MIDTHTHLYSSAFGNGYEEAIERSIKAGVTHLILPGIDLPSITSIKKSHCLFPDNISMAMGLHPTEVDEKWESIVEVMEKELETGNYVAVGEIGIDLYWSRDNLSFQQDALRCQLKIADRMNLPVILHSRDAFSETLSIIEEINPSVPLIFHSFTGNIADLERIRRICNPYFGINGVVTYKNAEYLREALPEIGLGKIILETDSPYLTPVPYRGKKNESTYLGYIRDKIGEVLNIASETVERVTDVNARKIFGI